MRAASTSEDKTLKVWDLEMGALVTTFTCDAVAHCCAFVGNQVSPFKSLNRRCGAQVRLRIPLGTQDSRLLTFSMLKTDY